VKKITKKTPPFTEGTNQAQLMGWMHLMIFTQIIHLQVDTLANAERKTFSTYFKKHCFLHLFIINFENSTSHKYVVQMAKSIFNG